METKKSVFEFPCKFPIKALGPSQRDFDLMVMNIIRKHAPAIMDSALKSRMSKNGKYISVTVTVTATSQRQLDEIYQDLSDCSDVLMAL